MDSVALTLSLSWIISGLLIIGISIPLVRGQVGPNRFYGVRFPQSFQSDDAWYAINRYGGRRLIVSSVPLILTGVAACFLPLKEQPGLAVAIAFLPLVFVLIPVCQAWRFARKYKSQ